MLWLLVVLQAMTPFIHVHAGSVQPNHASISHLQQGAQGDASCHALAADEHGASFAVAQGRPLRLDPPEAANAVQPVAMRSLLRAECIARSGAGLPAPSLPRRVPPDHTYPHALAPPSV